VVIAGGAAPVIRGSRIRDNQKYGINASEGGKGLIEDCEIRGNKEGLAIGKTGGRGKTKVRRCEVRDAATG
jgi:hypothetical protein